MAGSLSRIAHDVQRDMDLSPYIHGQIIGQDEAGKSKSQIHRDTGILRTTIHDTTEKDLHRDNGNSNARTGRKHTPGLSFVSGSTV